tara:strand:+ start:165 stop:416 length:252 start_codon:yes stop_codon:yes gene_type:complete
MYLFLNQYSFVVISILILSIIGFLTWRFLDPKLSLVSIVVMLSLLGSFYFTARGSVNQVENISELKILLSSGKPVVVQIFSDY